MKKILVITAAMLAVGLTGCGGLSGEAITDATEACQPHGGIKVIRPVYLNTSPSYEVECSNGKRIFGRGAEK